MRPQSVILAALAVGVPLSALGVVWAEFQSRALFVEHEVLTERRDALNVEWGQLLLEQNTWGSHGRVEATARDRLQMQIPEHGTVVVVRP